MQFTAHQCVMAQKELEVHDMGAWERGWLYIISLKSRGKIQDRQRVD